MAQRIDVPGQGVVEFPDGMSDDDIARVIKTTSATPRPELPQVDAPNWIEQQLAKIPSPNAVQQQKLDTVRSMMGGVADPSIPGNAVGNATTDIAQRMGMSPDISAGIGTAVNVGVQALPMAFGGEAKALAPKMRGAAEWLMQSALKSPMKYRESGASLKAAQTMLDKGVNVSENGADKLKMMADAMAGDVKTAIGSSTATVDKGATTGSMQDLISEIEKTNPTPAAARNAVESIYNEYMSNPLVAKQIPVQKAQEFKQGLYRIIDEHYLNPSADSNAIAGQKALARGLRQEIEKAVPEVIPLNAAQGELRNAAKQARIAVLRNNGSSIVGLSPLTHSGAGFATMLLDKNALAKSLIARAMNKGKTAIPVTAAQAAILGEQSLTRERDQP